ncbi:hypothetical protein BROUX41_002418 [Berkeleyomyces rouxiae]|uniref:uncharacterized protein n=1 Tax=Berkeleyomyces rouxiae TaxID=2035830 RepID=UPI003B82244B
MHLLNTETLLLREFKTSRLPPYAVLSHMWTKTEITYNDMRSSRKDDDTTTPEDTDYSDSDADSDLGGAPSAIPSFRPTFSRRMSRGSNSQQRARSRAPSLHRSRAYSDSEAESDHEAAHNHAPPHAGSSSDARSEYPGSENSPSPELYKIRRALQATAREKIKWLWVDSCCVNEKSQSDKHEAVINAWNLYENAVVCFVYLTDFTMPEDLSDMDQVVTSDEDEDSDGGAGLRKDDRSVPNPPNNWRKGFKCSQWFRRAWTLPELLASQRLIFMDRNWDNISRAVPHPDVLTMLISQATGIPRNVLQHRISLDSINVATKMTWMAGRRSTHPEDISYALAGLFNVHIDVRYGEGAKRAFQRLQHAILENSVDESILLWDSNRTHNNQRTGLLADCPEQFLDSGDLAPAPAPLMPHRATWSMTNRGLKASLFMTPHASPSTVGNFRRVWLNMFRRDTKEFMCFFVQQVGDTDEYARVGSIVPVATNFAAFVKEREQHTIVVAHTIDDEARSAGSPGAALPFRANSSSGIGAGPTISSTRPHVRFLLDSGVRRVVPHTPHHRPSWIVNSTMAECLSPIPHEDYHVAIVQFELRTPSHAAKVEGKFLIVACLRLLPEVGRWQCALRIDEAEDYTNEMPSMGSTRALRDSASASPRTMAQLDVGIEGTREIRAEVIEWIEWHESAFEIIITCPAPSPVAHASIASDRDRIFRGSTPLNLYTGVGIGISSTVPGSARPRQRFTGHPPVSGYPPLSSASQRMRMGRSMSVDHSTSPYVPPPGPPPVTGPPPQRRDRELSPPPSLRSGVGARKRDSWGGPPIVSPPTPLSPPRRPTTTRPGMRRPPSRYGHGRDEYSPEYGPRAGVGVGSYEHTPPFLGAGSGRRDSLNYKESTFGVDGPHMRNDTGYQSWSDRYWERSVIDESMPADERPIAPPSRRGTWTPAPGHSNFGFSHNHHSQSFQGHYDRDPFYRHHETPPAAPMPASVLSPSQRPLGIMAPGSLPGSGRVGRFGSLDEGPWGENLRSPTIAENALEGPRLGGDYGYYRR